MKAYPVEEVYINDLKTDPKNPNQLSVEQMNDLKANMEKFGFLQAIIIDQDNNVVDGAHRLEVYRQSGKEKIQAYRLNLTEGERRVLRQVMNKLHGEHDLNLDAEELRRIIDLGDDGLLKELLTSQEHEFVKILEKINEKIPESNQDFSEQLQTKNKCPKCGYQW